MNYLRTSKIKIFIGLVTLFILFNIYKFFQVRLLNLDLPKGQIVFSSGIDGDSEIYIMNINGTSLKQLTNNSATNFDTAMDDEPSFSSDGRKVVFVSSRQGKNKEFIYNHQGKIIGTGSSKTGTSDIYIMDLDGNNQIPLTYKELNLYPFFSPDGRNIVFEARGNSEWQTKMIDVNGSNQGILDARSGHYKFSSDGKKIYDTFQCDLSVMNEDGSNRIRLTNFLTFEETMRDPKKRRTNIPNFAFSRNGKKICFILKEDRGKSIGEFYNIIRFYIMNIDGSNLEQIYTIDCSHLNELYVSGYNEKAMFCNIKQLQYFPDDRAVIFIADFTYKKGIYLLDLQSENVKELTYKNQAWRDILGFTFTPDGKKIVFITDTYPKNYVIHALFLHSIRAYVNYFLFRKSTPFYDNKYLCIMDIDGKNYRRIAKLPEGTELGRDFIHWEQ
ncbi:MAG: hypothetical protein PHS66_03570 [Candidatus Omnitrophica bacterium]|nr:hypothetical protein [Candidatus Omnitrophota bacterium]